MINKQSLWFVTLFSLILVLSIYYLTLNDSSLASILHDAAGNNDIPVSVVSEESSMLVAKRIEEEENTLKEMENFQNVLFDVSSTSSEKNNAYNSLMALREKKAEEERIEKSIKDTYQLNSFAKINNDNISITIESEKHTATLANNIIKTIQDMYDSEKYITVKFQLSP